MERKPDLPDLSDYLAAMKRRRALLLRVTLPIMAIALALALGLPDIFVSTGLITFKNATIPGEFPAARPRRDKAYLDLYILGLKASVLSPPVLSQLLVEVPLLTKQGETREQVMAEVMDRARVKPVTKPILDPDSGRTRDVIAAFAISFDSRDPLEAQRVSTWLTNAFIDGNRASLQLRVQAARQFYLTASQRYGKRISELESQLAEFKAHHLNELPELTRLNLGLLERSQRDLDAITRQLESSRQERILVDAQLTRARMASLDEGQLGALQSEYNGKQAHYDIDHPDMLGLRRQIAALQTNGQSLDTLSIPAQLQIQKSLLAQVRQRYSEDHPDVKRIERQIAALTTQLSTGATAAASAGADQPPAGNPAVARLTGAVNALDTQAAGLERRANQLRAQLESLTHRVEESPLLEHEYKALTTALTAAHAKYDELSATAMSLQVTSTAIATGRSDELRLIEPPQLPATAAKPRRAMIVALGVVLAALLGFTAVVLREGFDTRIRGSRDVARLLHVWPLVAIPDIFDPQRARRRHRHIAVLVACTALASAAAVITGRIFYN
jgi:uncharacterized protein involved in exopolysaccharide biosynthesis